VTLSNPIKLVSLAADQEGVPGVTFRDANDIEFRLALPDGTSPVLRRFVPHRFTDKLTGDHHAYVTREDTPLAWEESAKLVDQLGWDDLSDDHFEDYFEFIRELARRAYADTSWCDQELAQLLHSTSDQMYPPSGGDRLVTLQTRDCMGDSPLHVLLRRRDVRGARRLVEAGIDVNAVGDMSETPLHIAVGQGLTEAVLFLLAAGADPDLRSEFGHTPRESAHRQGGAMADCFTQTDAGLPDL
jgi:ankyrin repeat protein